MSDPAQNHTPSKRFGLSTSQIRFILTLLAVAVLALLGWWLE